MPRQVKNTRHLSLDDMTRVGCIQRIATIAAGRGTPEEKKTAIERALSSFPDVVHAPSGGDAMGNWTAAIVLQDSVRSPIETAARHATLARCAGIFQQLRLVYTAKRCMCVLRAGTMRSHLATWRFAESQFPVTPALQVGDAPGVGGHRENAEDIGTCARVTQSAASLVGVLSRILRLRDSGGVVHRLRRDQEMRKQLILECVANALFRCSSESYLHSDSSLPMLPDGTIVPPVMTIHPDDTHGLMSRGWRTAIADVFVSEIQISIDKGWECIVFDVVYSRKGGRHGPPLRDQMQPVIRTVFSIQRAMDGTTTMERFARNPLGMMTSLLFVVLHQALVYAHNVEMCPLCDSILIASGEDSPRLLCDRCHKRVGCRTLEEYNGARAEADAMAGQLIAAETKQLGSPVGNGKKMRKKKCRSPVQQKKGHSNATVATDVSVPLPKFEVAPIELPAGGEGDSCESESPGSPVSSTCWDVCSAEVGSSENDYTCLVCLDHKRAVFFLPCKHMVCCDVCSNRVETCPCCRGEINKRVCVILC